MSKEMTDPKKLLEQVKAFLVADNRDDLLPCSYGEIIQALDQLSEYLEGDAGEVKIDEQYIRHALDGSDQTHEWDFKMAYEALSRLSAKAKITAQHENSVRVKVLKELKKDLHDKWVGLGISSKPEGSYGVSGLFEAEKIIDQKIEEAMLK